VHSATNYWLYLLRKITYNLEMYAKTFVSSEILLQG
jgi:hypothetical protein